MRYHNITKDDMLNGDGLRVVLWVAGCDHCCKDCQNPVTWDPNGGLEFDAEAKAELFEALDHDYISGITFSGGDPLFYGNREDVTLLAKEVKDRFPEKTIWLYTGFTYETIQTLPVMEYVDVLVDGEFVVEKKDTLKDLSQMTPYAPFLKDAAMGIVVCADKNKNDSLVYCQQDLAAATENMLVEAKSLGIGSCWLGVYPNEDRYLALNQYFKLPKGIVPMWMISFGYIDQEEVVKDKFDSSKVHYEKY